jgi:Transglutaminase-like superfamily
VRAPFATAIDLLRRMRRAQVSARDLPELVVTCLVSFRVERSLRRDPLPVTARKARVHLLGDGAPVVPGGPLPAWAKRRISLTTAVMRRGPVADTCLRRSLVLGHRLSRLEPSLIIGVRAGADGTAAHAWLRVGGRDLDPDAGTFAVFAAAG